VEFPEVHELPIDSRIVKQSAQATIRNLIDAVVELVTNCDDSYRRLEEQGIEGTGRINILVARQKGGKCEIFLVRDYAEGMTREELQKAVRFGGETSGFEKGHTVRGLFGRGLKESIISLGEGEIYTIKDNTANAAKIWWDENGRRALYGLYDAVSNPSVAQRHGVHEGNGTVVSIRVKNEKIRIPEYGKFKQQISDHYALRAITSSDKRAVFLTFGDIKRAMVISSTKANVEFEAPQGEEVCDSEVNLPGYGDAIEIKIFRSSVPLDSPRLNPFAKAGILIKSGASILDNSLFKYENEPAALYFWGEACCDGIAEKIKKGETEIIDLNRAGLEWRNDYCQAIQTTIENILHPLVQEKRRELEEKKEKKEVAEPTKKMLKKLCNILNELANKEFEEWESPIELDGNIKELTVLPRYANIELYKPRPFSVYAPVELVRVAGNKVMIESDNIDISLLSSHVSLDKKHSKYPDLHYGVFKVVGKTINEEGNIRCKLDEQKAITHVKVGEQKERRRGKEPTGRKGGFISDILPDEIADPIQRVEYVTDTGEIKIKIKFPGVTRYLGSGLEGVQTEQGKVFLAELIGEAFCKQLATRKLERGESSPFPGAEVDFFNSTVNSLQKKYLDKIHEAVAGWKFK